MLYNHLYSPSWYNINNNNNSNNNRKLNLSEFV